MNTPRKSGAMTRLLRSAAWLGPRRMQRCERIRMRKDTSLNPASRTASASTTPWLRRSIAVASCLLLLTACDWFRTPAPKADNFPVVVPFPLDKAGNTVRVEFELPPPNANGNLRPVFIGFRTVWPPAKERTPEQAALIDTATDYLDEAPLPLRLTLRKADDENGHGSEIVLDQNHDIPPSQPGESWRFEDRPNPSGIFMDHDGAGTDNDELIAAGKYSMELIYIIYRVAIIPMPEPGRYVLEAENIRPTPPMKGVDVELLVSHYHRK